MSAPPTVIPPLGDLEADFVYEVASSEAFQSQVREPIARSIIDKVEYDILASFEVNSMSEKIGSLSEDDDNSNSFWALADQESQQKRQRGSPPTRNKPRAKSRHEVSLEKKSHDAVKVAIDLLAHFNGGNTIALRKLVDDYFHPECSLKTPALDSTLVGRDFIVEFLTGLLDAHADAVMFGKNFRYCNNEVGFRIYFAGSKTHSTENDYLFKSNNRSVLDEVRSLEHLSATEVVRLRELERSGRALAVQGKGLFVLKMNEDQQVYAMDCTWEVTSFSAVEL